jgi:hypothetical protein
MDRKANVNKDAISFPTNAGGSGYRTVIPHEFDAQAHGVEPLALTSRG